MSKGQHASGQDWAPQSFNFGPRPTSSGPSSRPKALGETAANRILQTGGAVSVTKKEYHQSNAQRQGLGANAKRIDDDDDIIKVKTVPLKLSTAIMKARQAKGLSQAELAKLVNERASVITEYENAKAVPNESVLVRIEKALGMYLRGAKAGQPMEAKKTKAAAAAAPAAASR